MMQNNDSVSLEKCGSFCSECKFVLNSIFSIGTALSINECESITDKKPKNRNSLLFERIDVPNKDIINKNDNKLHNSLSKFPLSAPNVKYKDSVTSEEEVQVLLHKKLKEVKKVDKELNKFNKIYMSHVREKYSTRVKPAIIEDKILQSPEKLKIDNLEKQKSQISNYKCDHSKYSTSQKALEYVDKICEGITNDSKDLKNVHGMERKSRQLTDISCSAISTYSISQNTENDTHNTMTFDYFSQYNTLKSAILSRRKKISNITKNLLTLSTYLNGICKTILEKEDSNPSCIRPSISINSSKKVDKSTSPILLFKTCPTVTDLAQSQENSHDMYRYNPYRFKHSLEKKT